LSGQKVITDLFAGPEAGGDANLDSAIEHHCRCNSVRTVARRACDSRHSRKFAQGIADDFLTTLYLASTAPVVVCAGDECEHVESRGDAGESGCAALARSARRQSRRRLFLSAGMTARRLAGQEQIVAAVRDALRFKRDLEGQTVLITAGPTCEDIDPVRYDESLVGRWATRLRKRRRGAGEDGF